MSALLALSTRSNDYFDLSPSTEITLNLINPIFDRDTIDRIFTFPFKLPATPGNLAKTNHANRLDAKLRSNRIEVTLWIAGQPWYGELTINRSNKRQIEVTFQNESLRAIEKLEGQRIRSISLVEEVTDEYNPTIVFVTIPPAGVPSPPPLTIGINEYIFTSTLIDGTAYLAAQINAIFGPGVASVPTGLPTDFNEVYIQFSNIPRPFNIYIRPVAPGLGLFFDFFSSNAADEVERVNDDFADYIAAGGSAIAKYPVIKAPNIYDNKNTSWGGYCNYILPSGEHPNSTLNLPDPFAWKHTLLPLPFLLPVIRASVQQSGLTDIGGGWISDTEIQELLLWQNTPIDLVVGNLDLIVDQPEDIANYYKHTYRTSFNLAEFLPDLTALELLTDLADTFCLFFRIKQGRLLIIPVRDLLRAAPDDWTDISEPYDEQEFPDYNDYTLDYDRQGDDTSDPQQLRRRDGNANTEPLEVIAPFFTLYEREEMDQYASRDTPVVFRSWRIPYTNESGRSETFNLSPEPTKRMLWWRGLQEDSEKNPAQTYPLAGHSMYGYSNFQVGNYSLDWQGPGGLLETWWTDYIRLITQGRPIRRRVRLSSNQLNDLAQWKSVVKKTVYDEMGQTTAVIKSVQVKVGILSMRPAIVEFVTL